jgi:hypothetical protein
MATRSYTSTGGQKQVSYGNPKLGEHTYKLAAVHSGEKAGWHSVTSEGDTVHQPTWSDKDAHAHGVAQEIRSNHLSRQQFGSKKR